MKKIIPFFVMGLFIAMYFVSCKKDKSPDPGTDQNGSGIPNSFTYNTSKDLTVSIQLLSNNNKPIKGAVLSISDPSRPDKVFLKAVSDAEGYIRGSINVPAYLDTLIISPNYVGLINNVRALVRGKSNLTVVIGGQTMLSGDVIPDVVKPPAVDPGSILAARSSGGGGIGILGAFGVTYGYPSPYISSGDAIVSSSTYPASLGRPKYLETIPDVIDPSLLNYVNSSLPEGKPLTTIHPEYLTATVTSNIVITQTSDVWITFVSEGAGYLNTLGYYSYDTDNPPSSATGGSLFGGIDKITMIFPNASGYQSGGGLISGDKVKLGRFDAGTTIALVLMQNAWTGSGVNTSTSAKFYSESKFNPETVTSKKKHSVLLYDNVHKLYLIGFEDINRAESSDNDFNDLVVFASSNPVTAISGTGVAPIDKGGDSDGDGILDVLDDFPNDANKAYITYSPSATGWSSLAFEDYWPVKGDYDLNDLVLNYRYTFIKNAQNNVLEMTGEFLPLAAGAGYKNGFGVQLPVAAAKVASVTGQSLLSNYIQFSANGVESGQTNAVIIPFDNHENLLKNPDGSIQVNTDPAKTKVTAAKATVVIKFTAPVSTAELGNAPFNPFLISDRRRAYEIHLPNKAPTDKAGKAIIGTYDDNGNIATGRYYLNKDNAPWALSFNDAWNYPIEAKAISDTYLHFLDWAKSGGSSYADWYINTASGYRNNSYIYNK